VEVLPMGRALGERFYVPEREREREEYFTYIGV